MGTTAASAAVAGLRRAVEDLADALATPDLEALLACELAVEDALARIPSLQGMPAAEQAGLRGDIDGARVALLRCRRLGAGLSDFVRLSFDAQGIGTGYGRPAPGRHGQALNERI